MKFKIKDLEIFQQNFIFNYWNWKLSMKIFISEGKKWGIFLTKIKFNQLGSRLKIFPAIFGF